MSERVPGFLAWLRGFPCDICVGLAKDPSDLKRRLLECGKTHAAHLPRTRNHGDPNNVVPLGARHHDEQHKKGAKTFQAEYGYDAEARAAYWWERWLRDAGDWEGVAGAGNAETR